MGYRGEILMPTIKLAKDNKTENEFIEELRQRRFRDEADVLYLKITEEALVANTTPDYTEWLTLKATIRADLPYSE
jgi:hypothetical protein